MTVSLGKYLIKAFSTRSVRHKSSTTAWALACLIMKGLRKRVTRCLLLVVIYQMVQLVVVVVKCRLKLPRLASRESLRTLRPELKSVRSESISLFINRLASLMEFREGGLEMFGARLQMALDYSGVCFPLAFWQRFSFTPHSPAQVGSLG